MDMDQFLTFLFPTTKASSVQQIYSEIVKKLPADKLFGLWDGEKATTFMLNLNRNWSEVFSSFIESSMK